MWKGGKMTITDMVQQQAARQGKLGWALLWLMGVPIPVLVVLFLLRGCT
jgi:hypothetical protein